MAISRFITFSGTIFCSRAVGLFIWMADPVFNDVFSLSFLKMHSSVLMCKGILIIRLLFSQIPSFFYSDIFYLIFLIVSNSIKI